MRVMESILTKTTAWVPGLAGLALVWAGVHEWIYHYDHPHAAGPSGVLALGFLAGAAVAFAVMFLAKELREHIESTSAHLTEEERERRSAEAWARLEARGRSGG
jgi:hypothetical protein